MIHYHLFQIDGLNLVVFDYNIFPYALYSHQLLIFNMLNQIYLPIRPYPKQLDELKVFQLIFLRWYFLGGIAKDHGGLIKGIFEILFI